MPNADGAALELSRLERATGTPIGADPLAEPLSPRAPADPMRALAEAVLPALRRPPCVVSFSGGRDSSAVLAVAARLAREHGLEAPVAASLHFPGVGSTAESQWQELVVGHLGVSEWERIEIHGELDFLGETARAGLRAHGLLWPANAHFHAPIFARAAGGSVLTGVDGDGLLGWRWGGLWDHLRRPGSLRPRDALRTGLALAPRSVRAMRYRRRFPSYLDWLRPATARELRRRFAAEAASEPARWDRRLAWYAARRYLRLGTHSLGLLGSDHDVQVVHPLFDPAFLRAVAGDGGRSGYGTRNAAMRRLFGDLLPDALIARPTKAEFGAALWGPGARAFAAGWEGGGVDAELVDPGALREAWGAENPPLAAATVMQAAWLGGGQSADAVRSGGGVNWGVDERCN